MTTEPDGYKYVSFTTKAEQDDGSYLVSGRISDTSLDLDGERCDGEWLEKAARDWFKDYGNIREMHQPVAIGKAKTLTGSAIDGFDITAKIVDPLAVKKIKEGIYTGFSIGIKGTRYDRSEKALSLAPGGVIIAGKIIESSVVDVPCNTGAKFDAFKIAKTAEIGDVATAGAPPCTECGGVGKSLVDSVWTECAKCNGTGEGQNDILPGLNTGPDQHGEVGKVVDIYGWAELTDEQKALDVDDAYKKAFTDKERSDLANKDQAMPDGSFPIRNVSDLKNAIQAFGRAKDKVAAKAWIIRKAKELKSTDLLPDSWGVATKAAMADALIALALVNKGAEPGQWTHNPETLDTISQGFGACMTQEIEEMCEGEDERWDLQTLLDAWNGFQSWRLHEAFGGETTSPFSQGDDLTMFVSPDVMKAAQAENATEEEKAAPLAELKKSLGLDEIASTTKDISEKFSELEKVVETVKKMSAPREWALRASQEQQEVQMELEAATRQLTQYKSAQAELTSPEQRAQYDSLVTEAQSKVDALTSKIGA